MKMGRTGDHPSSHDFHAELFRRAEEADTIGWAWTITEIISPSPARCLLRPLPDPVSALEEMSEDERDILEIEISVPECASAIKEVEGAQIG
jgi:hypothetical protein